MVKLMHQKSTRIGFQWIHYQIDANPSENKNKISWQKPHTENKTGTKKHLRPNKISK